MTGPQCSFVAEYPCDRFCRVEVELDGERPRLTLNLMRSMADGRHREMHDPVPESTPILDELTATFRAPGG